MLPSRITTPQSDTLDQTPCPAPSPSRPSLLSAPPNALGAWRLGMGLGGGGIGAAINLRPVAWPNGTASDYDNGNQEIAGSIPVVALM